VYLVPIFPPRSIAREEEQDSAQFLLDIKSCGRIIMAAVNIQCNHSPHNDETSDVSLNNDDDNSSSSNNDNSSSSPRYCYSTQEEFYAIVSERYVLQLTPEQDELLDPLERCFRYWIPIPKHYYWQVVAANNYNIRNQSRDTTQETKVDESTIVIPRAIRYWHNAIYWGSRILDGLTHKVAEPLASGLGITQSRFAYVLDQMTPEEYEASRARAQQQRQERQQQVELMEGGSMVETAK
jgi:hypothetical protein